MSETLDLKGSRYSERSPRAPESRPWSNCTRLTPILRLLYPSDQIVAVFFIGYCLLELPSNLALKRFTPSKWIARIMVSWGIVTCCTAAVTSYGGLMACRVMLGICEAG